ncbi:MAG TPA: hypothetical protein VGM27_18620 [Acidobacteriaceae bacterium]
MTGYRLLGQFAGGHRNRSYVASASIRKAAEITFKVARMIPAAEISHELLQTIGYDVQHFMHVSGVVIVGAIVIQDD